MYALQLDQKFHENQNSTDFFQEFPLGVVVLDEQANIQRANLKAREILSDAESLHTDQGRLSVKTELRFGEIIRRIASQPKGSSNEELVVKVEHGDIRLVMYPFKAQKDRALVMVLMSIVRHDDAVTEVKIRACYGLTKAEARIALAIARGKSIGEIAEKFQVSPHTVRAQLKAVFKKTKTQRQAELVNLVLTRLNSATM